MSIEFDISSQIEELLDIDAEDFEIAKVIKKAIKSYLSSLNETFENNSGKDFLVRHTKQIDTFIKIIYKYILRKNFGNYFPSINAIPITLVALGSYGREQLCVYSDIDLMIVYKDCKGFNTQSIIENIIQIAWDCGLKLGHRVHEVGELFDVSNEDITIKSSLIESRFIYGSKVLFGEVNFRLKKIREYNQKEYIVKKLNEYNERLEKHSICMEPNIKDGIGGLRDANTLFWIANVKYGINKIKDLSDYYDIFTAEEYKTFRISLELLFRVRSALHLSAKKKQDTLVLQYLPDIAKKLRIVNSKTISAELKLTKMVLEAQKIIHRFCAIFIKKITSLYLYNKDNIKLLKNNRVSKNIYLVENNVLISFNAKYKNINLILNKISMLPDIDLKFNDTFLYILDRENKENIDKNIIHKILERDYYLSIIQLLYKANVLHKVLPPFSRVLDLAQFDGYHKSPVAQHSIETLKYIENIKDEYIQSIYNNLSQENKILIKAVGLFHDIGKGRKNDHSLVGEKIFKVFFKKLNFNEKFISNGAKLIRYHTKMSECIQKEDIYNEKVILSFVSKFVKKDMLDMIYILTYADISSVKEELFSKQTSYLLKELYNSSLLSLDKSELISNSTRRYKKLESIKKDERFKNFKKISQKKIINIESDLLFIKYKKEHILNIVDLALNSKNNFDFNIINNKNLSIEILKSIDLNLGYLLGKLSFLSIVNMDIFLLFDDKKYFKIEFLEKVDESEILFIEDIIKSSFDMSKKLKLKKPIINRSDICIDKNHSDNIAKMTLTAKDQKGLFGYIAKIFDEFGVNIESAKIHTSKNRVKDLILIKKNGKFVINIDKILHELCS
jgi:[protein-PII] uridylyltransferase